MPKEDRGGKDPFIQGLGYRNRPKLCDSVWYDVYPYDTDHPPEYPDDVAKTGGNGEMKRVCINRHTGFINGLLMDWSVRKVGLKELWTLKWHREFDTAGRWTKTGGIKPEDWPQWMQKFKDY